MANFFDMCDITKREANAELNADPEVKAEKVRVANEACEYWKGISPVGDPKKDPNSGQYKESVHVHEGKGVAVIADAPNAWFVEYGTNNISESACRARTEAVFKKRYGHNPDGGDEE